MDRGDHWYVTKVSIIQFIDKEYSLLVIKFGPLNFDVTYISTCIKFKIYENTTASNRIY